jgi:hypothetical protein
MPTYSITRRYFDPRHPAELIAEGLTLDEAREHCRDPETSSRTCTDEEGRARTAARGAWFDGYEEE